MWVPPASGVPPRQRALLCRSLTPAAQQMRPTIDRRFHLPLSSTEVEFVWTAAAAGSQNIQRRASRPHAATSKVGEQASQRRQCDVSALPANVRGVCQRFIERRNTQQLVTFLAISFFNVILVSVAFDGSYASSFNNDARLLLTLSVMTSTCIVISGRHPEDELPEYVSMQWIFLPLLGYIILLAPPTVAATIDAPTRTVGLMNALLMLRYIGSCVGILSCMLYYGRRIRIWSVIRLVEISLISFRLSLLLILNALSPEPRVYPPLGLSFSSAAGADAYMLLLWTTLTLQSRQRIHAALPCAMVPSVRLHTDLARLSQAARQAEGDLRRRGTSGHIHATSPESVTDSNADIDTDTVANSSHVGDLMDFHGGGNGDIWAAFHRAPWHYDTMTTSSDSPVE